MKTHQIKTTVWCRLNKKDYHSMTFHLSQSPSPLARTLSIKMQISMCGSGRTLSPSTSPLLFSLFGKPPSQWGCTNITQRERNSPLMSAHGLPRMQRTPYVTCAHTHTFAYRLHPGARRLGSIFLSVKISFPPHSFHNNARGDGPAGWGE